MDDFCVADPCFRLLGNWFIDETSEGFNIGILISHIYIYIHTLS